MGQDKVLNETEARRVILEKISIDGNSVELAIIDDETLEKEWGWVFFYQSKKYMETGDLRDMLAGNAPYIVNKYTGEVVETGTAYDINHYIHEYEESLNIAHNNGN